MARVGSENRQLLTDRIDELATVIEILKEIRDNPNIGEKTICDKYGMNFHKYRRYAYDTDWFDKSSEAAASEESTAKRMNKLKPTLSWYEVLWCDIMGMQWGDVAACPSDLEEGLEIMLSKLTDKERTVIHCRYEEGLNLVETGQRVGVTDGRVRQIEAKALRKLRYSNAWIQCGQDRVISKMKIQKFIEDDIVIATKHQVLQRLDDELVSLRKLIQGCTQEAIKEYLKSHPDMPIDDLELSVRAFNCLKRKGINTVTDLRNCTKEDLMQVRNLGWRCIQEIERVLNKLGYDLRTEEESK